MNLLRMELELLRELEGEIPAMVAMGSWKAGVARSLASKGLATPLPNVEITDAGRDHLNEMYEAGMFDD